MGARTFALVAAVAGGAALLAAGCGGSAPSHVARLDTTTAETTSSPGSSNAPGSTTSQSAKSQLLAYSACMRAHGEPRFPDPNAEGQIKQQLVASGIDLSSSQYQAAAKTCQYKLPGAGGMTQAQFDQMRAEALTFSRCIQAHGFPNYPDPGVDGREPDPSAVGIDQATPRWQAAHRACFHP